jgi:hypothetical protein
LHKDTRTNTAKAKVRFLEFFVEDSERKKEFQKGIIKNFTICTHTERDEVDQTNEDEMRDM